MAFLMAEISNFDLLQSINHNHVETVQRLTALETSLKGVPERVTALEQTKYYAHGIYAAVAAIFSTAVTLLVHWFKRNG